MSASFSRGLSEGLKYNMTDDSIMQEQVLEEIQHELDFCNGI